MFFNIFDGECAKNMPILLFTRFSIAVTASSDRLIILVQFRVSPMDALPVSAPPPWVA